MEKKLWVRAGYYGLLGIGTGYLLFLSLGYISSSSEAYAAKKLIQVSQSYEEIKAPLVKALKNPSESPGIRHLSVSAGSEGV
ncbi:hypothetical protein ACFSQ7_09795 [Paenibacillus rhizoplanae]